MGKREFKDDWDEWGFIISKDTSKPGMQDLQLPEENVEGVYEVGLYHENATNKNTVVYVAFSQNLKLDIEKWGDPETANVPEDQKSSITDREFKMTARYWPGKTEQVRNSLLEKYDYAWCTQDNGGIRRPLAKQEQQLYDEVKDTPGQNGLQPRQGIAPNPREFKEDWSGWGFIDDSTATESGMQQLPFPTNTVAGVYEIGLYHQETGKNTAVYVGNAINLKNAIKAWGATGRKPQPTWSRDFFATKKKILSKGFKMTARYLLSTNGKREKEALLQKFDYAWCKKLNGSRRDPMASASQTIYAAVSTSEENASGTSENVRDILTIFFIPVAMAAAFLFGLSKAR